MHLTKQKILDAAIELFNQQGVNAITLRDIALSVGISTGNLAYHFKNKDYIIEDAFQQMAAERNAILAGVQLIPSFENINRQLLPLLEIAWKYRFLSLDTVHIIRHHPHLAALQREFIAQTIDYTKAVIDYSVGSGNMRPEAQEGQYQRLAHTTWMLANFWIQQLTVRGLSKLAIDDLRKSIWDLVLPHLTPKGIQHFSGAATAVLV